MSREPEVSFGGQTIVFMPERAALWVERDTLILADTHFGKAATFRSAGLAVPRGTTEGALDRLDRALERSGASRVVFVGDFLHAREGRVHRTLRSLADWRDRHPDLHLTLVRGNHDRHAGDPPDELRIECVDSPWHHEPFRFDHHPRAETGANVVAGHLHPAVRLAGRGRQRIRLGCFWLRPGMLVLPAFGDFTGNAVVSPTPEDRLFVVAEDAVIEVSG